MAGMRRALHRPAALTLVAAALVALALVAGCAGTPAARTAPAAQLTPLPTAAPVPAPVVQPTMAPWALGASPLPLRADGFGQVLDTPLPLRDRRMTAVSTLPAPADGLFAATVSPVTPLLRTRMGETWSPACPVGLADLRYLTLSFRGFDGAAHTGELVVNTAVAEDVVEVFRQLFVENFPLEQMRLPTTADLEAPATGDGNNSAGYVCRAARGQARFSEHAYGLAVDLNPFQNPMVKGDLVLPELAGAYVPRDPGRPGLHHPDGPAVRAFAAVGWTWGGTWRSSKDYMHFSKNGQ